MTIVSGNHFEVEQDKDGYHKKVSTIKDLKDKKSLKDVIDSLVDETLWILAREQARKEYCREQIEQLAGKNYHFVGEYNTDYPIDPIKKRAYVLHEQFVKDFYRAISKDEAHS